MVILVVQEAVDDYGSTQDQDIVVPLTMVVENHPPSPSKKTTTTTATATWMVACLLGLTAAAVVSSAVMFVSRKESSSVLQATRTDEEAFLLHRNRKDGTCVVQSGLWPRYEELYDDDGLFRSKAPYATCFVWYDNNVATKYCWSRSYLNKGGDWKPCKPKGYGSGGWTELEQCDIEDADSDDKGVVLNNCCGTPCTEFEKT